MKTSFLFLAMILFVSRSVSALTLPEALAKTLADNFEIRQAKAEVAAAADRRVELRAVAFPDLRASVLGAVQGGQRAGESDPQPFAFAHAELSQPLFAAGLPASLRRGDLEVLIAEQNLHSAVTAQLLRARLDFYAVIYQRERQNLQRQEQTRLEQNSQTQEARYQAGTVNRGIMTSAQLQASAAALPIGSSRRAAETAQLDLANAMGWRLDSSKAALPDIEGEVDFLPVDLNVDAAETALQQRDDLKLARLLVRAATEDQRIVEAASYPSLNANLAGDYIPVSDVRRGGSGSANRSDDFFQAELRAGVSWQWRIIDNGQVAGAALRQRSAREINELQLQKIETGVRRELAQLQSRLRTIATRHAALSGPADLAAKNLNAIRQNIEQGQASQVEFRDAENRLSSARGALLDVTYEQAIAAAEWDRVTGRYFQFSNALP